MRTTGELAVGTVTAAQAGDERALEALVESSLPLVYNIVGRALEGHADVDDVVQETMLRVVNNLSDLREPERYRSWLVAIAIRRPQPAAVGVPAGALRIGARHRPGRHSCPAVRHPVQPGRTKIRNPTL